MSFEPRTIVDGQVVIAFVEGVVITIFYVETWTKTFAERLYEESTVLTRANPNTIVRLHGGEPSAAVRKRVAELQAELEDRIPRELRRVAVLTDSVLVRGAMTALRWITGDQMSGFSTDDVRGAASWVAGRAAMINASRAWFTNAKSTLTHKGLRDRCYSDVRLCDAPPKFFRMSPPLGHGTR